jgi:hypothetical protein
LNIEECIPCFVPPRHRHHLHILSYGPCPRDIAGSAGRSEIRSSATASTEQLFHRALGHLLYRHDLTYHEKCDAACASSINTNDTRLTRLTLRRHGGPQLRCLQPGPQPASCRYVHHLATFKSLLLTPVSDHTRPAHIQHRSLRTLKPDLRRRHITSRAALLHVPRRPNPHTAPTPHRQHQGTL